METKPTDPQDGGYPIKQNHQREMRWWFLFLFLFPVYGFQEPFLIDILKLLLV